MDIYDILKDWLKKNGYDGLCYPEEECGCLLEDLAPCIQPSLLNCKAGHKEKAPQGSLSDYFVYAGKRGENDNNTV